MGRSPRLPEERQNRREETPVAAQPGPQTTIPSLWAPLSAILLAACFAIVLIAGIMLRVHHLSTVALRSPDEHVYTRQAQAVTQSGFIPGIRGLVAEYNSTERLWIYPPPTRIAFIGTLALAMKGTGRSDESAGACLSCGASIATLVLALVIGLRFLNPLIALFAVAFLAVSPMDLAISRRTWQDALLAMTGLGLVWLALEINRQRPRLLLFIPFIAVGIYASLLKEPGLVIYALVTVWLLWRFIRHQRAYLAALLLALASGASVIGSFALQAWIVGGPGILLDVFRHIRDAMPTNAYAIEYQSGPWYQFLLGYWIVSPASAALCIAGITWGLVLRRRVCPPAAGATWLAEPDEAATGLLLFFSIAFMAIATATPYCQNMRYVSVLFLPFYLLAGTGLWALFTTIARSSSTAVAPVAGAVIVCCLFFAAVRDYDAFERIFIRTGIPDVSIKMLNDFSR